MISMVVEAELTPSLTVNVRLYVVTADNPSCHKWKAFDIPFPPSSSPSPQSQVKSRWLIGTLSVVLSALNCIVCPVRIERLSIKTCPFTEIIGFGWEVSVTFIEVTSASDHVPP